MRTVYSIGDSVVWGAELENKQYERFSYDFARRLGATDCNNASAGVSNDYIFRNTIRDIYHWKKTGQVWSEETGWIDSDEFILCMGVTSPTRFEWWDGKRYEQERLWKGYDKWGKNDEERTTLDFHVLNQTELIPSFIRTLQGVLSVKSICERESIPYIIFNTFFRYNFDEIKQPKNNIDRWGRKDNQLSLDSLWNEIPIEFKLDTMYDFFKKQGGGLLPRNHPTKESHQLWSDRLYNMFMNKEKEDEF